MSVFIYTVSVCSPFCIGAGMPCLCVGLRASRKTFRLTKPDKPRPRAIAAEFLW